MAVSGKIKIMRRKKNYLAYRVANQINSKVYIGITERSLSERWKQHINAAIRGMGQPMPQAIRKYGANSFIIEEIACARNRKELGQLERVLISQYNSYWDGYNATYGGDGGGSRGKPITLEGKKYPSLFLFMLIEDTNFY